MPLAHRWTDSHRDCPWLCSENWQTLHFLRLGQFYSGTVLRVVMNHAALSASVFSCHYHWIRAACPSGSVCAFYQKNNVLSCDTWGSRTNCNTEMVQSIATLNTALVKKILWYFSFRFPRMNHTHLCLLHHQVICLRFSQWGIKIIQSWLE